MKHENATSTWMGFNDVKTNMKSGCNSNRGMRSNELENNLS